MHSYAYIGSRFGVTLIIMGIVIFFVLSSKATLTCTRGSNVAGQCEIVTAGLLGTQTRQIPLNDITGVWAEKGDGLRSRRGRRQVYRVVLNTKRGTVPLTQGFSWGFMGDQHTAAEIDRFLSDRTAPTLKVEKYDVRRPLIIGGLIAVFGILVRGYSQRRPDDWIFGRVNRS